MKGRKAWMRRKNTGRDPSAGEIAEAERFAKYHPSLYRLVPSAVAADHSRLAHINTYGDLPEYYIDQPFSCRKCGKREIWRAADQKWYYEEAKGHIDAKAVECYSCRKARRTQAPNATVQRLRRVKAPCR